MNSHQRLLVAIRAYTLRHGASPSVWEVASATGQTEHRVLQDARELARAHQLVECPNADAPLQLTPAGHAEARRLQEGAWSAAAVN